MPTEYGACIHPDLRHDDGARVTHIRTTFDQYGRGVPTCCVSCSSDLFLQSQKLGLADLFGEFLKGVNPNIVQPRRYAAGFPAKTAGPWQDRIC